MLHRNPFSYCSLYFEIEKVVALNLFASFIVMALYIDPWLLFCIATYLVIALSTIAIAIVSYCFYLILKMIGKRKSYRYRLQDQE